MMSEPGVQLVAAFVPLLLVLGFIGVILFVTGQRAARQQRPLERLLEETARQTALLRRIDEHLDKAPRD